MHRHKPRLDDDAPLVEIDRSKIIATSASASREENVDANVKEKKRIRQDIHFLFEAFYRYVRQHDNYVVDRVPEAAEIECQRHDRSKAAYRALRHTNMCAIISRDDMEIMLQRLANCASSCLAREKSTSLLDDTMVFGSVPRHIMNRILATLDRNHSGQVTEECFFDWVWSHWQVCHIYLSIYRYR